MNLKDKKILVVDDDPDITTSFKAWLENVGAHVTCAGDGVKAVDEAEKTRYDLIILDMMLPKRSGFLVLAKISNGIPVVMITANEGRRHQQYAESLGVKAYLLKPIKLERLQETCERVLDENQTNH
jgi:CheY-like chemotaxis protein